MDTPAVPLKEYIEKLVENYIHAHTEVHRVERKSLEDAAQSMALRLEGMNEFRSQLDKQAQLFVTRDMLEAQSHLSIADNHRVESGLSARIAPLEDFQKSFYVKVVSVGIAFTVINIAIQYFGLGR